jgi:hypothetical protein
MEQLNDKIDRTKCYVYQLLAEMGLMHLYSEDAIEDYYLSPIVTTADTYKAALNITDLLIYQANGNTAF